MMVNLTRRALIPGFVGIVLTGGIATTRAAAKWVEARYEVYGVAGIHLLTNRTTIEQAPHQYGIEMDLDTRGLARMFVDLDSHSDVYGQAGKGVARPQTYEANVRRNGVGRHYRIDYGGDGRVIKVSASPASGQAPPMTEQQIRGTVDQLTAYFLLERQLSERGTCALVVRVFDGRGLYNLRFTDNQRENLAGDGHQNFAGPAQSCDVVREDLVANPDRSEGAYDRGKLWYARVVPGGEMMPVRMEYDTDFGVVKGYLAEVRAPGIDLRLMPE
ncbi:MAG: DUF3108 domain-containing protein [Alphaproteobacteria bacterium]|nr:DUF3108 domain-containing protein [Alphaproteobacteria bacterium]